ncbi:uncharacterized protein LOC135689542 [Rhopilema esculentum]|uniref:uncharacterized protein LOC135689542 n=1 Tax=Rhopilema esculentum TaxID=499914 RepID=UPI0031D76B63
MATTIDKHYATEDEKKPFVNDEQPFSNQYERISNVKSSTSETYEPYTESQMLRDPRMKYTILMFVFVVIAVVLVTCILSIVQGVKYGASYLLQGISIICIGIVALLLIFLIKKDDFPKEKTWFVFFVGFCIFIEAVLTNVVLYN